MYKHFAITDCPLRVCVIDEQSSIGFSYPRILIEAKLSEEYFNCDVTLDAIFRMKEKDFNEWWEDAEPKTTHEVCEYLNFDEIIFRKFIRYFINIYVDASRANSDKRVFEY